MKTAIALLCVALALMIGCDDDECVNCPGPAPTPTLDNIWPNADHTLWTYDYQMRKWEGDYTIYSSRLDVPTELPSWSEILELCRAHAPKFPYETTPGVYTLEFDSTVTTEARITAQNLEVGLVATGMENAGRMAAPSASTLLRRLYDARPDLREKILASEGPSVLADRLASAPEFPMMIHGGPWEKTETWIGTYSDTRARLHWKFLTSDLFTGSEFSYQLLPEIDPEIVLRGRVERRVTVTTPLGTYEDALDCLYMLSYGITTVIDLYGNPQGFIGAFDYGRVIYVPEIGPVYSYERWGVEPKDPPSDGMMDITLTLTGTSLLGE